MKRWGYSMMENKEYYTIQEFAVLVNKRESGIYRSANKGNLKKYSSVAEIDGKKKIVLHREALTLYNIDSTLDSKNIANDSTDRARNAVDSTLDSTDRARSVTNDSTSDSILEARLEALYREKIEHLERELEEAKATIKEKDKQISELSQTIGTLAMNAQELTRNSQVLQAQIQQPKKGFFARLFAPKEENKSGE